jgi:hypothetical protein
MLSKASAGPLQITAMARPASVSAQEMLVTDAPKTNTTVSSFGNMVRETIFEGLIHKVITKPTIPFALDYAQQTQNIERITNDGYEFERDGTTNQPTTLPHLRLPQPL